MRRAAEEEEAVIGRFGPELRAGVDFSEACGRCVTGLRGELAAAEPEVGAEAGSGPVVRGIASLVSGPARGKTQSACVL